ncbi:MAG: 1-deoxy-D-xylulose-5-phosphate synthase [Oscillospiraceae bacterium]|nr:1-deoxy-D-xylulose-5-phosphate synthase [Oscillospiraceae bacterium]
MRLFDKYIASVKDIPACRLDRFCADIRRFLIQNISRTGGHLASNLGVVELTVALHRAFDASRDRIVFDVGHQCYTHKLLTGRKDGFGSLRLLGEMSGFPKPAESICDAFVAGHASTSVSAALGMARARTLLGENYRCVAVLGDGALTGGLSYEGLNDAGQSGEPLIVVLNDNGMSITKNVGGVARHLARLRLKPQYFKAKKMTHRILDPLPGGKMLGKAIRRGKQMVKDALIPGTLFSQMGFEYLGPADGHDVRAVTYLLRRAAAMKKPVVIHLVTQKGRGYPHSERDPSAYHGVQKFNIGSGETVEYGETSFAGHFGEELVRLAEKDRRIVAVTAAMQSGTGLDLFAKRFPKRFFDVGIAESHAVTMAAGMAKQGLRPVVAVYSTFLQRSYDQIMHDVALQNLPVVFAVGSAGLCGEDGETHHGVFDPLYLSSIPNMTLWAPAVFGELRDMLAKALEHDGPIAIRYPKNGHGPLSEKTGRDATIVTYGTMARVALEAVDLLERQGISAGVCRITSLKPLEPIETHGAVFILEDNPGYLCRHMAGVPLNTGDRFIPHGTPEELLAYCKLDAASVAAAVAQNVQGTS